MSSAADRLADRLLLVVKAALGPLLAQHAAIVERCNGLDARIAGLEPAVSSMRERVAVTETRALQPGPPGKDGAPGADGFTVDEMTATQDPADDRLITLAYRRGDQVKAFATLRLSTPRYCGTFDETKSYVPGDQVTHGGSMWHCHTATATHPGDGAPGWTLQVKRGKDGRDAGR